MSASADPGGPPALGPGEALGAAELAARRLAPADQAGRPRRARRWSPRTSARAPRGSSDSSGRSASCGGEGDRPHRRRRRRHGDGRGGHPLRLGPPGLRRQPEQADTWRTSRPSAAERRRDGQASRRRRDAAAGADGRARGRPGPSTRAGGRVAPAFVKVFTSARAPRPTREDHPAGPRPASRSATTRPSPRGRTRRFDRGRPPPEGAGPTWTRTHADGGCGRLIPGRAPPPPPRLRAPVPTRIAAVEPKERAPLGEVYLPILVLGILGLAFGLSASSAAPHRPAALQPRQARLLRVRHRPHARSPSAAARSRSSTT